MRQWGLKLECDLFFILHVEERAQTADLKPRPKEEGPNAFSKSPGRSVHHRATHSLHAANRCQFLRSTVTVQGLEGLGGSDNEGRHSREPGGTAQ